MRAKFRPEFLNRLDEIVVFNPLRKSMLADIVRLEVAAIAQRLNTTHQASLWVGPGVTLDRSHQPERGETCEQHTQVEPDAVEQLALSGFDAAYGARPLKRLVTKALESPLSRAILNDELHAGDTAAFVVEHERLALQIRRGDEAPG